MDVHEPRRLIAGRAERVDDAVRNLDPCLRPDEPLLALELEAHRTAEHEKAVRMQVVDVRGRRGRLGRDPRACRAEIVGVHEQHDPELGSVGEQLSGLHLHDGSP